jgi:cytochrome c5
MRFSKLNYLKLAVISIAVFALAGFAWTGGRFGSPRVDNTLVGTLGDAEREAVSIAAFNEAAKVFFSARCANCHPAGDVPTQGDAMTPHTMGVTRGKIGMGVYGQKCTTCHQSENLEGDHLPPGTSKPWHMPPASDPMPFQGLTAGQLCRNFKDPKHNGGSRTAREAMEHVHKRDPLVMWGWNPGNGRTTPPLSFEEFSAKLKEWIDNGAACPE